LSAEGYTINEIVRIYQTGRDTALSTFASSKEASLDGLHDADKSGRLTNLTKES